MLANTEALSDHQFQVGEDITNNVFACSFLRLFVFEDARAADCEQNSRTALAKWIEQRRANARVAVRVNPRILEAYVGQYQFETLPERILSVSREDGRLFVNRPANKKSELFADSESKFFLKTRQLQVTFVKDGGQVTHMDVVIDVETLRANRNK